ncbi:MAG: hypothetical protein EU547_06580 [Promethearchaeota archaeon]|nr:MAG: hypothetical protein EU547_06580 [Candidatus Lokiarchaeota archaeon]
MSKIKKKPVERPSSLSEDIKLIKMIEFSGWIFLLAFVGYFGAWAVLDILLKISFIDFKRDEVTFAYLVFTGTSAAFCFGLSTKIKNNKERKKEFFLDWLLGEFLFCMFAIFALSAYQW